jgi:hypothetical protein
VAGGLHLQRVVAASRGEPKDRASPTTAGNHSHDPCEGQWASRSRLERARTSHLSHPTACLGRAKATGTLTNARWHQRAAARCSATSVASFAEGGLLRVHHVRLSYRSIHTKRLKAGSDISGAFDLAVVCAGPMGCATRWLSSGHGPGSTSYRSPFSGSQRSFLGPPERKGVPGTRLRSHWREMSISLRIPWVGGAHAARAAITAGRTTRWIGQAATRIFAASALALPAQRGFCPTTVSCDFTSRV